MLQSLTFNRSAYLCVLLAVFIWFALKLNSRDTNKIENNPPDEHNVNVALTMCEPMEGESQEYIRKEAHLNKFRRQYDQVITLLKSLVISWRHTEELDQAKRKQLLNVIIFSNNQSRSEEILSEVSSWAQEYTHFVNIFFRSPAYPSELLWLKNIYAPCATLRLLLPKLLPEIRQVIYMDTDFIFFRNIRHLWKVFKGFSPETLLAGDGHFWTPNKDALASVDPDLKLPTDLPHHSTRTGIMALNLEKFRQTNWLQYLYSMEKLIPRLLLYPDGVILNSFLTFHENPRLNFSCSWNFKEMHFSRTAGKICQGKGISSMQGVKGDFIKNGTLSKRIYQEFENVDLSSNFSITQFVARLEHVFGVPETCSTTNTSNCDSQRYSHQVILHYLRKLV